MWHCRPILIERNNLLLGRLLVLVVYLNGGMSLLHGLARVVQLPILQEEVVRVVVVHNRRVVLVMLLAVRPGGRVGLTAENSDDGGHILVECELVAELIGERAGEAALTRAAGLRAAGQ